MTAHTILFTDGLSSVEFGGSSPYYQVHDGGFDPGQPPIVKAKDGIDVSRSSAATIARVRGNRAVTVTFYVQGTSRDDLQSRIDAVTSLIEKARRYWARGPLAYNNRKVHLVYQMASSPKRHYFEVVDGNLKLPSDFLSYGLVPDGTPRVFQCQLFLECKAAVYEPPVVIVEKNGSGTSAQGGLPLGTSDYVLIPGVTHLSPWTGVLSFWLYNTHAFNSTVTIISEESGYLQLHLTGSKLQLDINGGAKSVNIPISGGNWPTSTKHHIALSWGAYSDIGTHGLQLYLNGTAAAVGDVGATTALTALGRIFAGRKYDASEKFTGAIDDIRLGRYWDGVYLTTAADLYGAGCEVNRYSYCTRLQMQIEGDSGAPNYTDVKNVRGDLLPELDASIPVVTGGTGIGRLRVANRIGPSSIWKNQIECEDMTLATGVTTASSGSYSGTGYIVSAKASGTLSAAAYTDLLGPDWFGSYRVYGLVNRPVGAASGIARLILTQGTASYGINGEDKTVASTGGVWQWVDFGQFNLPIWDVPEGQRATVTAFIYDQGTVANPFWWDRLVFMPYEERVQMLVWEPDQPLETLGRLHVQGGGDDEETRLYRVSTYDFAAATGTYNGGFPNLVPGQTNRIVITGNRDTNDECVNTDYIFFYGMYRPRYLLFR